ncbi:MAG: hypothetical protein FJY07_13415, partial [Bacteroidetes bacterium]|nr:hypothetical protein [Bacteroidota bacterium]
MGAADLISNGKQVAIIDYHDGDSFSNSYGNARLTYYNPSGTPTAYFDGGNAVVGGYHTTSMYSYYLPKYNARIAIPSAFNIHINGSESGYNYSITAVVDNLSGGTISNTYFQFALTQSNIVYSWQGMSEINHALRIMAPNQNGTLLTVMSGNSQTINLNFTRNSAWPEADCEIVAFIQNNTSKEVLQAIKLPLNELLPLAADAGLIGVSNLPVGACSGIANPIVQLKNFSSTNVNSAVIKYSINGGILANYNWSGNLTQNQVQNVSLPQMSYTVGPNNNFIAYLYSTNGVADLNPVNDTTEGSFNEALTYGFNVNLELLTDNNPSQTTWQVKNAAGTIITQGGPYNQPNTLIQQVINVNETGCYRFIINDSGNDGICCSSGNGYYRLTDYYGEVIQLGGDFDNIETTEFNLTGFQVNAMVFLEGPFDEWSLDMNTSLNQEGFIPLVQPFSGSPWNYTGTETVTFIPNSSV